MTRSLTFQLPENLELDDLEARYLFAGELYRQAKISLGQAAAIVGVTKKIFIEQMGKYGISMFSESEEDLFHDIKYA